MRFSPTLFLWALSGTAAMLTPSSFKRDLKLSAELGIHPDELLASRKSLHAIASAQADTRIEAEFVSLPIDHDNSSVGEYLNRYWVSEQFYKEGGPVFVFDVGESEAEGSAQGQLGNSSSFFSGMLKEFNGLGIVWEHRYYGKSLPYNVSRDTLPEHFQYLNNRQALADIPVFAANFTRENLANVSLTPNATPWVMVGGSYAGMRAAFTRDEYPETIYAAFASSAPVEARIDMSVYFDQVYAGTVANGYLNCTRDIKAALEYIDRQLSNETTAALIKQKFFGKGAETNSNGDFTAALAGIFGVFQAYGVGGGIGGLGSFCEHLETDPSRRPAPAEGLAPSRGKKYVAERWSTWPVFVQLINENYETNCNKTEMSEPLSCNLNPVPSDPDMLSWTWQYCTEWGYYQTNNFGPHSLLSKYQNLDFAQDYCDRSFPEALKQGYMPAQPQVEATNKETGGWKMRPSNVYWSGGQFDPWRTLSPLATGPSDPKVTLTTEVPQCGVKTSEDTLFGYVMPGAEHCFDFRTSFAPGAVSRGYFYKALKEWLGCFKADL
ncbi:unnamed protein product [Penicillium bialowiezense]